MRNATRTALIGILGLATISIPTTATADDDIPLSRQVFEANNVRYVPPLPEIQVENGTNRQHEQVDEALRLFDEAGLELPPLVIRFSNDSEDCEGNLGIYRTQAIDEPAIVTVCTKMRLTLVHELAHAWDDNSLTDELRRPFMDRWQVDDWNDKSAEWHDRAAEIAAHTIAYTLLLGEPTDNPDILRFVCGYETLTGRELPAMAAASCRL